MPIVLQSPVQPLQSPVLVVGLPFSQLPCIFRSYSYGQMVSFGCNICVSIVFLQGTNMRGPFARGRWRGAALDANTIVCHFAADIRQVVRLIKRTKTKLKRPSRNRKVCQFWANYSKHTIKDIVFSAACRNEKTPGFFFAATRRNEKIQGSV